MIEKQKRGRRGDGERKKKGIKGRNEGTKTMTGGGRTAEEKV